MAKNRRPPKAGKPAITGFLFNRWFDKLSKEGFDEEIDFSK
jgi:hypothetical protein